MDGYYGAGVEGDIFTPDVSHNIVSDLNSDAPLDSGTYTYSTQPGSPSYLSFANEDQNVPSPYPYGVNYELGYYGGNFDPTLTTSLLCVGPANAIVRGQLV